MLCSSLVLCRSSLCRPWALCMCWESRQYPKNIRRMRGWKKIFRVALSVSEMGICNSETVFCSGAVILDSFGGLMVGDWHGGSIEVIFW